MALWFTAKGLYPKWVIGLFHFAILCTLAGKNVIMGFILYTLGEVNCEAFVSDHIGLVVAKALAIVFMSVKLLSNIPERLMLKRSIEFSAEEKPSFCGRFPFGLYITWQVLTDLYMNYLSVALALSKPEVIEVFANFAAVLIFADAEVILGTFVQMVMPIKEDTEYLTFHVRKAQYLARKRRHSRTVFMFTMFMMTIYILVAVGVLPA